MKSYRPEELFDIQEGLNRNLQNCSERKRRMGDNPHANGGILLRDLRMPDFRNYAVDVKKPGVDNAEATKRWGNSYAT